VSGSATVAGAIVRGVLLDALGRPCPAVELWRVPGDEERMLMILDDGASTKTEADGTFAFEDVAPGSWLVGPPPQATHVPLGSPVDVPTGVSLVEIVLRLPPEFFVQGVVLDPDDAPAVLG
jgi:hypothetical protein